MDHKTCRWIILASIVMVDTLLVILLVFGVWRWFKLTKNTEEEHAPEFQEHLQLERAEFYALTEGFHSNRVIGSGGSSIVYLGTLTSGKNVAVKRLNPNTNSVDVIRKTFLRELRVLGKLRHRNLVKILGFYMDRNVMALILDYIPNGSLYDVLYIKKESFSWRARYKMALGIAQGLHYLHFGYGQTIVHCDLKPSNILLDMDFRPRIGDFGISRVLGVETASIMWSVRYTAPEVVQVTRLSPKADVYSFGVVLMELLTRRQPSRVEESLRSLVQSAVQKEEAPSILDQELRDETQFHHEMIHVLMVALACTQHAPSARPDISSVLGILEIAERSNLRTIHVSAT